MDRSRARLYFSIFLGIFTVILGGLFIFEAADIYYSGVTETANTGMYSREAVGARLMKLLPFLIAYIVCVIAGGVLAELAPAEEARVKADPLTLFLRMKARLPRSFEGEYGAAYRKFRKGETLRLGLRCACAVFCVLAAVMSGVYLFRTAHFPAADLTAEVLAMLKNILPWLLAALVFAVGVTVFELLYAKRALPAVRRLIVAGRGLPREKSAWEARRERAASALSRSWILWTVRGAVLAAAVVLIVVGAVNGEARIMLIKAINICTECIGLG